MDKVQNCDSYIHENVNLFSMSAKAILVLKRVFGNEMLRKIFGACREGI
jgi:hypothetical protein